MKEDFNIIGDGVASFGESDRSAAYLFPRSDLGPLMDFVTAKLTGPSAAGKAGAVYGYGY